MRVIPNSLLQLKKAMTSQLYRLSKEQSQDGMRLLFEYKTLSHVLLQKQSDDDLQLEIKKWHQSILKLIAPHGKGILEEDKCVEPT